MSIAACQPLVTGTTIATEVASAIIPSATPFDTQALAEGFPFCGEWDLGEIVTERHIVAAGESIADILRDPETGIIGARVFAATTPKSESESPDLMAIYGRVWHFNKDEGNQATGRVFPELVTGEELLIPKCGDKPTPAPEPTLEPSADPDGDGSITYFEEIWGTDPLAYTSFEELSVHPGTIYAKMRVSQPFEIEDMNGTLYQVVRPIEKQDNGTPDYASDDHLVFEVVLFPYAKHDLDSLEMEVAGFPIDEEIYPIEVREFLLTKEEDVSNVTDELRNSMLVIVNGFGEGYSESARTDVEAIDRVLRWNNENLEFNPQWEYPPYEIITSLRAGDMFSIRKLRWSTTRATIFNAELRAIGIPSKITHNISCICNPNEDEECDNRGNHPQNLVYVGGKWILFDYYSIQSVREKPHSYFLVMTDTYRDNSEAIFDFWIQVIDAPRAYFPFEDLYYIYNRREN